MEFISDITLEVNSNTAYTVVGAKQGDNDTRIITAHLVENGNPYVIENGAIANFRFRKPDGKAIINTAQITDRNTGEIKIGLTSQALAAAGRGYADIVLTKNNQILSTVSFIIVIMSSPQVLSEIVSSNEFGYVEDIVSSARDTIYESEAWARGTRAGVEVTGYSRFDWNFNSPAGVISRVDVNQNTFMGAVGYNPGTIREFKFSYLDPKWSLVLKTTTGGTTETDQAQSYNDLSGFGITIYYNIANHPNVNDYIIINVAEPDITYHNNAKYYAERAEDSSAHWIEEIVATGSAWKDDLIATGSQWDETIASTGASYLAGTEQYYNELVNLTVSAVSDINPGVVKTSSGTGEGYNFEFHLPKGDPGDVELMTCFVNVNDVDVSERSYGQLIFDTTDSLFYASVFRQPMESDIPKLLLNFNDKAFISKVGLSDLNSSNNYTYGYNFQYNSSQNKWYLDSAQQYVNLEEYGIAYTVKTGMTLNNNDIITISLKQQADFSIGEAGENEGMLFLGIRTEG